MICTMRFLLAALLIPALAAAQEKPVVEIGTNAGFTILTQDESTVTYIGIPGQGFLRQPSMYASFFTGGPMLIDMQLGLSIASYENGSSTTIGFGGQVGYLFNGPTMNSPFLAAELGVWSAAVSNGYSHSDSDVGIGGKIGYRFLIGRSVGLRLEGGYRRWMDSDLNEFKIGMGLGGIVHGT